MVTPHGTPNEEGLFPLPDREEIAAAVAEEAQRDATAKSEVLQDRVLKHLTTDSQPTSAASAGEGEASANISEMDAQVKPSGQMARGATTQLLQPTPAPKKPSKNERSAPKKPRPLPFFTLLQRQGVKQVSCGPQFFGILTLGGAVGLYGWCQSFVVGHVAEFLHLKLPNAALYLACGSDHTLVLCQDGFLYGHGDPVLCGLGRQNPLADDVPARAPTIRSRSEGGRMATTSTLSWESEPGAQELMLFDAALADDPSTVFRCGPRSYRGKRKLLETDGHPNRQHGSSTSEDNPSPVGGDSNTDRSPAVGLSTRNRTGGLVLPGLERDSLYYHPYISSVQVRNQYSVCATAEGRLYHWGIVPFLCKAFEVPTPFQAAGFFRSSASSSSLPGNARVSSIACTACATLVLDENGFVYAFGDGSYGENASGAVAGGTSSLCFGEPLQVGEPIVEISGGERHTLCLGISGTVWAFGDDTYGQCGCGLQSRSRNGLLGERVLLPRPVLQPGTFHQDGLLMAKKATGNPERRSASLDQGEGIEQADECFRVSAGRYHSCVATEKGNVYAWGVLRYTPFQPDPLEKKVEDAEAEVESLIKSAMNRPRLCYHLLPRFTQYVECGPNYTVAIYGQENDAPDRSGSYYDEDSSEDESSSDGSWRNSSASTSSRDSDVLA
ncbi:unnamed protein product [Amoebophrya sp. A25]|nr:unnamed protein product [Amoebophrya sp. A25]|eukprot:GSA25T00018739001.1